MDLPINLSWARSLLSQVRVAVRAARTSSHSPNMAPTSQDLDCPDHVPWLGYGLSGPADVAETASTVQSLGRQVVTYHGDVADRSALDACVTNCLEELGPIDIVIANAAIAQTPGAPFWAIPADESARRS